MIALCFLIALNVCAAALLMSKVFSQNSNPEQLSPDQTPVVVRALSQPKSPLQITVTDIDNSHPSYQKVLIAVRNSGEKSVRAYVVLVETKSGGKALMTSFSTRIFQHNQVEPEEFLEERANIKSNDPISLTIDYVQFTDGTSWGKNTQEKSLEISGILEGRRTAIQHLKQLLVEKDEVSIANLLNQEPSKIVIESSDPAKPLTWQKGFQRGYKSVVSAVRRSQPGDSSLLLQILNEMNN